MQYDVYLGTQTVDVLLGRPTIDVSLGVAGLQGVPARVGFAFSIAGFLAAGEDRIPQVVGGAGPLAASACAAKAAVAPTSTLVFKLYQNGAQVGTVTWTAGQVVGVVVLTTTSYAAFDYFELEPPAAGDPTFKGGAIIFSG